jgi:precorrin-2 dehydrogenase/sirohydrochlorin ferrochelatase
MRFYPVHLNISGMTCLVVGGGDVAERKVQKLLECGGRVVVVSRHLTTCLEDLKGEGRINHIPEEYRSHHMEGAFLVIGATDKDDVNREIYADAEKRNILVNIVDDPGKCRFYVPSVVRRGDLLISITTGGKSPTLAKRLRGKLEDEYGNEYKVLLHILGRVRGKMLAKHRSPEANKEIFEAILDTDILAHIRNGEWDAVKKIIFDLAGERI